MNPTSDHVGSILLEVFGFIGLSIIAILSLSNFTTSFVKIVQHSTSKGAVETWWSDITSTLQDSNQCTSALYGVTFDPVQTSTQLSRAIKVQPNYFGADPPSTPIPVPTVTLIPTPGQIAVNQLTILSINLNKNSNTLALPSPGTFTESSANLEVTLSSIGATRQTRSLTLKISQDSTGKIYSCFALGKNSDLLCSANGGTWNETLQWCDLGSRRCQETGGTWTSSNPSNATARYFCDFGLGTFCTSAGGTWTPPSGTMGNKYTYVANKCVLP